MWLEKNVPGQRREEGSREDRMQCWWRRSMTPAPWFSLVLEVAEQIARAEQLWWQDLAVGGKSLDQGMGWFGGRDGVGQPLAQEGLVEVSLPAGGWQLATFINPGGMGKEERVGEYGIGRPPRKWFVDLGRLAITTFVRVGLTWVNSGCRAANTGSGIGACWSIVLKLVCFVSNQDT